jgi:hypothetical protein
MPLSQIVSASIENGSVAQVDLATGVAGTGPAFSAYLATNQILSSAVYTKLQLNTERFDTNNNFDPTTNYRFTPTVAGYYQINYQVYATTTSTASGIVGALYKNGSVYEYGLINSSAVTSQAYSNATLVYMNGTTDYLEVYINLTGTGTLTAAAASGTTNYMSGFLARGA